jgi:type VI secretion system protein
MRLGMSLFRIKEKIFKALFPFLAIGLVSCTIEDLPELSIDTVSIYAAPDANHNSAIAVDLVLVYNQELLKTLGKMSAGKYFASSKQLLLDNPSLLDIWHWELVPGQIVEGFKPPQDKGDAYGAYVFANYLTPGDHRVRVAPNGIVKILLLRDDLRNLEMFNSHDLNIGTTMSNVNNTQTVGGYEGPCQRKLGPIKTPMQPCKRRSPCLPLGTQKTVVPPCTRPSTGKPIQIITRPLNAPPRAITPKPYMVR